MLRLVFCSVVLAAGLGHAASPATEWAREELETYAQKIFGQVPKAAFLLPGETQDFADDFRALKDTDGYAVRRRGDTVFFIADNPKGHVNGVHRWLERNSDIIWPRPAEDLCFYTSVEGFDIARTQSDYRDIPAFTTRHLVSGSDFPETWRWVARNAVTAIVDVRRIMLKKPELELAARKYALLGAFDDLYGDGHNMELFWFPRAEFFKAHPEYWMEIDGKRWEGPWSNFCETNPGFVEAFSKSVVEKIAKLPEGVKTISILMEDQSLTCTCQECMKAIALPDGTTVTPEDPAFRSTRFFLFFNKVARRVAEVRPDLLIMQFAYLHLAVPPKVKIERNVVLKFCPFPRDMHQSVVDGPSNRMWRVRTDDWLANTPNLYWREYYFCANQFFPRPICDTAALDLRYILSRGVRKVFTESPAWGGDCEKICTAYSLRRPFSEFFTMNGVEIWTTGKLAWDPHLDPAALRADFLRRTFGPAAKPVAEFYRLIHEGWNADSRPVSYCDDPYLMTLRYVIEKGNADKCATCLSDAVKLADNHGRRKWIERMQQTFGAWVSEAKGRGTGAFEVPFNVDGKGKWAKFPTLMPVRGRRGKDDSGSNFRICSDGKAFKVEVEVFKQGVPVEDCGPGAGGFLRGDKAELFFGPSDGSVYQFVFDSAGRKFEARGPDAGWTCDWKVSAARTADGWRAVAEIPFASLGFAPNVNPRIRFLPVLSMKTRYAQGVRNFSWKAAMPHKLADWGELNVAFAP